MDIKKQENINVYNYGSSTVILPTRDRGTQYTLAASSDGEPSMIPLTWSEIEFINSNSPLIKMGVIMFDDDVKEQVYEALRIVDWKSILTNEQIEDILLKPTVEKLNKILAITNNLLISRVKGIHTVLKNNGKDILLKVDKVVLERYKEIASGKIKSEITLTPKSIAPPAVQEDVNNLKAENQSMKDELAQMKAMMEKLMANQSVPVEPTEPEIAIEDAIDEKNEEGDGSADKVTQPATPKKSPGRPKKNN
jgi:hypothetical protein